MAGRDSATKTQKGRERQCMVVRARERNRQEKRLECQWSELIIQKLLIRNVERVPRRLTQAISHTHTHTHSSRRPHTHTPVQLGWMALKWQRFLYARFQGLHVMQLRSHTSSCLIVFAMQHVACCCTTTIFSSLSSGNIWPLHFINRIWEILKLIDSLPLRWLATRMLVTRCAW